MTSPYDTHAFSTRVNYAAQCIRKGSTGGRSFDTCFEMYDGEFVVTMLVRKAERNPTFAAAMLKYWLCIRRRREEV
jgi:cystathionine beta-lyase family protein involved in aluminum resistance